MLQCHCSRYGSRSVNVSIAVYGQCICCGIDMVVLCQSMCVDVVSVSVLGCSVDIGLMVQC